MKQSVILEMYYKGRGMSDYKEMSEQQRKIAERLVISEKEFLSEISTYPKIMESYNRMYLQEQELNSKSIEETYIEAFKFGVLLGIEITK